MIDDSSFLKIITFEDLRQAYSSKSAQIRREKETEFKERARKLFDDHKSEITTCQTHDEIVNLCIHPFTESGPLRSKLGYKYLRADPLYEIGEANYDFLVYKSSGRKPIAIFGEVKSSITNFKRIIEDLEKKKEVIESNRKYIIDNYFGTMKDPIFEYVLAVSSSNGLYTRDAIWENKKEIILWIADLYEGTIGLGKTPREKERNRMQHHDPKLTRYMSKPIPSSKNTFDFFPQSHTVLKTKSLILSLGRYDNLIKLGNLREIVDSNYFFLDESVRKKETELILENSIKSQFLSKDDRDSGTYKMASHGVRASVLERDLMEKWIKMKIEEKKMVETDQAISDLRKEIMRQQKLQPTLFDEMPTRT